MSDAYGQIESSSFVVKDVALFRAWFDGNVTFELDEFEWWQDDKELAFYGGGMYPNAQPRMPIPDEEDFEDKDSDDYEWDLQAFAMAFKSHLIHAQEVIVMAVSTQKRSVCATILMIPMEGEAVLLQLHPHLGQSLLGYMRQELAKIVAVPQTKEEDKA